MTKRLFLSNLYDNFVKNAKNLKYILTSATVHFCNNPNRYSFVQCHTNFFKLEQNLMLNLLSGYILFSYLNPCSGFQKPMN